MGVGPIPFTSIVEYSKLYEVDDFEEFLYVIRAMDNTYLSLESSKSSKPTVKSEAPPADKPKAKGVGRGR